MSEFVGGDFGNVQGIVEPVVTPLPPIGEDQVSFDDLVVLLAINNFGVGLAATAEIASNGKNAATIGFARCWMHLQ